MTGQGNGTGWWTALCAVAVLGGCGDADTESAEPQEPTITTVAVSPSPAMVAAGELITFAAEATFSDGTSEDVTTQATWGSTDDAVLARRANSEFRGVAEGTAEVTAIVSDVVGSTTVTVTPSPITNIEVTPAARSIDVKETFQFQAIGTFASGGSSPVASMVDWTSSDPSIVTVSAGLVTGVSPGTADVTATSGEVMATASVTVREPTVVGLAIRGPTGALPAGETRQLIAEATLSSGSTVAITADVEWTSDAPAIATVGAGGDGSPGLVTGVREGQATITARHTPTGQMATRNVSVAAPELARIVVEPADAEAASGDFVFFAAVGVFSDGSREDFTRDVTWRSSNPAVAEVGNDGFSAGRASASTVGTATISVTDADSGISSDDSGDSATLTVLPPVLRSLQVEPQAAETPAGRTFQFRARGNFSDGTSRIMTDEVEWSSGASTTATVDQAGLATGLTPGEATIRVRDLVTGVQSGQLSAELSVTEAVVEQLEIVPANPVIAFDRTRQVDARGTFSDGSERSVRDVVAWQSSDTSVVAATPGGLLRAVSAGTATITATDVPTNVTATTIARVEALQLLSVDITPNRATLPAGAEMPIVVEARFNNGEVVDLTDTATYANSNPTIATRGTTGNRENRVFALAAGTTVITAEDSTSGMTGRLDLTVSSTLAVRSVAVSAPSPVQLLGTLEQYRALGTYDTNDVFDLTHAVTWSSTSTTVAAVSNAADTAGIVEALATGSSTINATFGAVVSRGAFVRVIPEITKSWNGPTQTVDGTVTGFSDVGSVTFSTTDFGPGATVGDLDISVDFLKTDGSCANPGVGSAFHQEIGFRLRAPDGTTVDLALSDNAGSQTPTWTGSAVMSGSVVVTFDQSAASVVGGGTPVAGTFRPNGGNLNSFNGVNPIGNWVLQAQDTANLDPLCVNAYSITIRAQ